MFNKSFKKRVLFIGIPDMAYICLDGMTVAGINIVGVLGPKKNHQTYIDFKAFVKSRNLNFIEYDKLDEPALLEKIEQLKPDIAVVCSFNYKIPKALLESVKGGFINVHPSLLPLYRGPNPYSPVIINNEKESGVTLHFMDETFDTGDIISQRKIPLSAMETMGTLFNRTNILAFDMLLEALKIFEQGDLARIKQPTGDFIRGDNLAEEHLFINYKKPALEIESLIRALNPFVSARTLFRKTITRIHSADVIDVELPKKHSIGSIVQIENDKFYIATGKGLLVPTSMQFGSFFAGSAKEFIKILNPQIGEKFE